MEDRYLTIKTPAKGLYREKGSRFIAFGYPVMDEDSIKELLASAKKEYHDARHICYAYRLGYKKELFRMNDDGEPSGTGGKPLFGLIQSKDLTNILILVVRYFGGIQLGTSRLASAYKNAAHDMIINATIIEKYASDNFRIFFPYEKLNDVMKIFKEEGIDPANFSTHNICCINFSLRKSIVEKVLNKMNNIEGLELESLI